MKDNNKPANNQEAPNPALDLSSKLWELVSENPLIKKLQDKPFASVAINPKDFLVNIIIRETFCGVEGKNLAANCFNEKGAIDEQKYLQALYGALKRIMDGMFQDLYSPFFLQNMGIKRSMLAKEFQSIFAAWAEEIGLREDFEKITFGLMQSYQEKCASIEGPAEQKPAAPIAAPVAQPKADESRPKRDTMGYNFNRANPVIPPVQPPVYDVSGRPRTEEVPRRPTQKMEAMALKPPGPKRHDTLRLIHDEDVGPASVRVDGMVEVEIPTRKSSIPINKNMVDALFSKRHQTLVDFPALNPEQLDFMAAEGATLEPLIPALSDDRWEPEAITLPGRTSYHSVNPPPSIPSASKLLATEMEDVLQAMQVAADREFRAEFIKTYRIHLLNKNKPRQSRVSIDDGDTDETDETSGRSIAAPLEMLDEEVFSKAFDDVIRRIDDAEKEKGKVRNRDLTNLFHFYGKELDASDRRAILGSLASRIIDELPKLKVEANTQFKQELIESFEDRYPLKEKDLKNSHPFNDVLESVVKGVNARMKKTPEEFESYKEYYPKGYLKVVRQIAEETAAQKAREILPEIQGIIQMMVIRYIPENEILSVPLENLQERYALWTLILCKWLYGILPFDNNKRSWLLYFFGGQNQLDNVQDPKPAKRLTADLEVDDKLQEIFDEIYPVISGYASRTRMMHGLPVLGEQMFVEEDVEEKEDRIAIDALMSGIDLRGQISVEGMVDALLKTSPSNEDEIATLPGIAPFPEENLSEEKPAPAPIPLTENNVAASMANIFDDEPESDTGDTQPKLSGVSEEDAVVKLEIPRADQKAQEFSNLADYFARNTNLPVSRGPMGSMPPGPNEEGDNSQESAQPEPVQIEAALTTQTVSGNAEMTAPPSINVNNDSTEQPFIEQTADAPQKKQSWFRRHVGKIVAAAAVAASTFGGFYAYKTTQDFEKQSTPMASVTPTTRSTNDVKVASTADVKTAPSSTADAKTAQAPETKTADGTLTVTPEMIASVQNPELKKIMSEGKFEVKANAGGYGQQIRAYFDAEINYKVINHQITPEQAKEMTAQLDKLQQDINFGAAVSYYEKYGHMSYSEVNAKRSNPASDSLFTYLDRNGKNAGMGKWESWRSGYGSHAKMAGAQEAKKHFEEKYEQAMLNFTSNPEYKYDQRSAGNIHWGAQGGDKRLVQNENGQWLPYFAECANIVLGGHEKTIDIDLDQQWTDEPANGANGAPAVNPSNSATPGVSPLDGGSPDNGTLDGGSFGKTGLLNNRHETTDGDDSPRIEVTGYTESDDDMEIEVAMTDLEDTDGPSFAGIVIPFAAAAKRKRKQEDEDPEIEIGEEVDIDLSDLEEEAVAKAPAVRVTSSTLSPEREAELAEIDAAWDLPAKQNDTKKPAVIVKSSTLSPEREAELAEIDAGWDLPARQPETKKPAVTVKSSTLSPEREAELAEIDAAWDLPAKEPTLEEKMADINKNMSSRRQALLERGEVFVPSLSEDLNGSVMLAIKNGFLKQCYTGAQQDRVEAIVNKLRITQFAEYEVGEKGTYAKLSTEKLAELQRALGAAESIPEAQFQVRQEVAGTVNEILKAA